MFGLGTKATNSLITSNPFDLEKQNSEIRVHFERISLLLFFFSMFIQLKYKVECLQFERNHFKHQVASTR